MLRETLRIGLKLWSMDEDMYSIYRYVTLAIVTYREIKACHFELQT